MERLDKLIDTIRQAGERLTIQRRLLLEALCASDGHQTIVDLQARIEDNGHTLSETTIYRNLQWLKDLGLVCQTDMGQAGIVYSLVSTPQHHHLICLQCGAMIQLEDRYFVPLRDQLREDYGFIARIDHMAIYGLCANCAE